MDLLKRIEEAKCLLYDYYVQEEDIVIAYSPLVERLILKELNSFPFFIPINPQSIKQLNGVKVNNEWPYNEIVVYDKRNAPFSPNRLVKITLTHLDVLEYITIIEKECTDQSH